MRSGDGSLILLLGCSRVRVHNWGELESIYRRGTLAWAEPEAEAEAEGASSRDPAVAVAEGEGAQIAAREDLVGASMEGTDRGTWESTGKG